MEPRIAIIAGLALLATFWLCAVIAFGIRRARKRQSWMPTDIEAGYGRVAPHDAAAHRLDPQRT